MSTTYIGNRRIGDEQPLYIMADLGLTNGGDMGRALELIDMAAEAGVEAVKFQMIDAERLLGDHTIEYTYPTLAKGPITENMLEMFKGLEFSDSQWGKLKSAADSKGLDTIITSHYEAAVARIDALDLPLNKVCTWSMNHRRMIEDLAKNGKPLLFDTGTITRKDLVDLDHVYRCAGGGSLIVLHDFHTECVPEMNFRAMEVYRELGHVYGYTPQGRKDWLDFMSIGMGASVLEKRLTTSRQIPMNGHWKAHEPDELKAWVEQAHMCRQALGTKAIIPTQDDLAGTLPYYKSAYLLCNVKQGELIRQEHLEFKRPGTGVSSWEATERLVGSPYQFDQSAGEMLKVHR